ncbi:hypothetical protein EUX98_g8764 [Antrodiella citrinella]|uniref:Uncharacterized protein n=1 Tax=Antrodiella citrinella TaxID=2447956 RepID=A0A4S4M2X5_9APHY|nr:hypothetical protein EUX98_g8764 [Antrodiella citrinella]
MVMPVSDALVTVDQEQSRSQNGTPAPSSSQHIISPSNALAVPARRVDISKDFQNLLSQLREEEEEEELMDVDVQSSDALGHTQPMQGLWAPGVVHCAGMHHADLLSERTI